MSSRPEPFPFSELLLELQELLLDQLGSASLASHCALAMTCRRLWFSPKRRLVSHMEIMEAIAREGYVALLPLVVEWCRSPSPSKVQASTSFLPLTQRFQVFQLLLSFWEQAAKAGRVDLFRAYVELKEQVRVDELSDFSPLSLL